MSAERNECVKVVVRVRPFNSFEKEAGETKAVEVNTATGSVVVHRPETENNNAARPEDEVKQFTFDKVYDDDSTQRQVFDETARPIVDSVIEGFNGTIFCYGQTGTGKTFTMEGVPHVEELRGIMPNSFYHVFDHIDSKAGANIEFLVRASFLEIYNEEVYDLLNSETRSKMEVKESKDKGIFVKDLSMYVVKNVKEIEKVLRKGQKSRSVGATKMNPGSSRSHSIFTIFIETCETDDSGQNRYRAGKLNLVDLAGSERQKKTGAEGDRLQEAKAINLSLSALGNVIKALVSGKAKHVPFRDSKLTRLLQDSLGGNTKTVMVANVGPALSNFDETISTLRYADRAKHIKNTPRVNEDPKDTMLRKYTEEIALLKAQLEARRASAQNGTALPPMEALPPPSESLLSGENPEFQSPDTIVEEVIVEKVVVQHVDVSDEIVNQRRQEVEIQLKSMEEMSQREREEMLAKQSEAAARSVEYEAKLKQKHEQLLTEQQELERIERIIKEKQDRLLHGGQAVEEVKKKHRALQIAERKLAEQKAEEHQLLQELRAVEENENLINQKFESQQQEYEIKTLKLKQLWEKYQKSKQELVDLQEENERDREEISTDIRELTRELKYLNLIMEHCVPVEVLQVIEQHAQWDPVTDEWHIPGAQFAGNQLEKTEPEFEYQPSISFERLTAILRRSAFDPNQDFSSQVKNPQVQEVIRQALMADMAGGHMADPYLSYNVDTKPQKTSKTVKQTGTRPKTASRNKTS
eukprot:TRINITY_DN2641_c0_g2_i1.p1 TRINITY_DN2641_c0_g2~~TRINITY_DN2641_c0_g2_i1.p1  ORF type:complete len:781 (-),score=158.43 TRINITY_DN2641_c0_g2_i1:50-2308(-)